MYLNEQQQRMQWPLEPQQFCQSSFGHHSSLGPLQQPQNYSQQMSCIYHQYPTSCNAPIPFYAMDPYSQSTFCQYWPYLSMPAMAGGSSSPSSSSTTTGFQCAQQLCNHQAGNPWLTSCPL
ncbi:hypothetical protein BLA29_004835 [Euroglyphus maynei]|uniref:Uncharacterized protein n=1 Tax=Euroglyphus maynei TaxID=6958 RepID=A0A1Y3B2C5_EURMA|nr:hypothetical protein BLA29_004835 [Euroglyphus maynei]